MAAYLRCFLLGMVALYTVSFFYWDHCTSVTYLVIFVGVALTLSFVGDCMHSLRISSEEIRSKAVVITGCDSGFGNFFAKSLHSMGFLVFAGCLDKESQGAKELEVKGHIDRRLIVLKIDVTSDSDVSNAVAFVKDNVKEKGLWCLINNAGVGLFGMVEWIPLQQFERLISVNTIGMIRMSKAFLPLVIKAKGRIINMTSVAGAFGLPGYGSYAVSKFAAVGYTDTLRREMAPFDVKVVNVMPYLYRTELVNKKKQLTDFETLWNGVPDEMRDRYGEKFAEAWITKVMNDIETLGRSEIHEVVDVIAAAITSKYPKTRYTSPGFEEWLLLNILSLLPISVQDALLNIPFQSVFSKLKQGD